MLCANLRKFPDGWSDNVPRKKVAALESPLKVALFDGEDALITE